MRYYVSFSPTSITSRRWSRGRLIMPADSPFTRPPKHRALRVLAILGGTFDPIHYGHLRLAADVRTAFSLAEVRLIPGGIPPHRPSPVASAEHRFAMTSLGCAEFAGLTADP